MRERIDITDFPSSSDRMAALILHYQADRNCLERLYTAPCSPLRRERLNTLIQTYSEALDGLRWHELSSSDRVDCILFRNLLAAEQRQAEREARHFAEMEPLVPFAADLIALEDARRQHEDVDAAAVAARLDDADSLLREMRAGLEAQLAAGDGEAWPRATVAYRAAQMLDRLREVLKGWFEFSHGYDPAFTWWIEMPYRALEKGLQEYADFLRARLAGVEDADAIIGDPIGRDALGEELAHAMIPYTPEELIAIGECERDWCLAELHRAARDLGCGDDWRAALERVKSLHVDPGEQPGLVRDLALEAVRYLQEHDLVTVPPLALECWRMEMMTPEQQKVNPFFLGGETIIVSFPTNTMEQAQKRMSLRGNNRHFARATVQHELIPGHHLQAFAQERYHPHRRLFYTPFWTEGWTLHWEMLLWEQGFAQTPEDRIGMLFWRLHRCARVLFSLGFHLGEMTPQECIEMLVDGVGHERDNAEAEVRRSFGGAYHPLYQCAYLIGGLQVHALYNELVGTGRMTARAFHDAVLHENCMPIAVLRALLSGQDLEPDFRGDWRFYPLQKQGGPPPEA